MTTTLESLEYEVVRLYASNLALLALLKTVEAADGKPILSAERYVTYDQLFADQLAILQRKRHLQHLQP